MAGITLGFLKFVLGFDSLAFEQGATDAQRKIRQVERSFQQTADSISSFGRNLTAAITLPLVGVAAVGIREAQATAAAMGQVNAALTSMGPVAGRSADQLARFADQLELNSLFEADDILQSVTANMLTFGNVTGTAFDRAQQAVVDIAARMGTDLQSATIMVGRALNDPVRGMTALARSGIQFTDAQKQAVAAMVAGGNAAGAQAIILGELEKQFGGAAAAAQNTDPMNRMTDAFKQFAETVGTAILPILPPIADAVVRVATAFQNLSPSAQQFLLIAGGVAAAVGPIAIGLGAIIGPLGSLVAPMIAAGAAAGGAAVGFGAIATALLPFIAIAAGVAAAGVLIYRNWDTIAPALQRFGEQFMAAVGPTVQATIAQLTATMQELWRGPMGEGLRAAGQLLQQFGPIVAQVIGNHIIRHFQAMALLVQHVVNVFSNMVLTVSRLLQGDFVGAARSAFAAFDAIWMGLPSRIIGYVSAMVTGIRTWIVDRLNAVFDSVRTRIEAVKGYFFGLYDAVVGHSYIPDMVDQIGQHMARLDETLVAPARGATTAAAGAFRTLQQTVGGILNRLFPEQTATNNFRRDMAALDEYLRSGAISAEQYAEAVRRLRAEFAALPPSANAGNGIDVGGGEFTPPLTDAQAYEILGTIGGMADGVEVANDRIGASFEQTARDVLGSLRGLTGAIKDGDFFDILDSIVGLFGSIAGAVGGINIGGTTFGGARAMGGPVSAGRTYLVGERGPELFTAGSSGRVISNDNSFGGGKLHITMGPTGGFWAEVRNEAGEVVASAAPMLAQAGSAQARGDALRDSQYRIPA